MVPHLPPARFKESPEDFVVEEIPAYEPSGSGEHLFVTFTKRLLTTEQAVARIARALGADPRAAGYAGQKDRVAVATQTASLQVPLRADVGQLLGALDDPRIRVVAASRHEAKLKPGHLRGNRFVVTLRGLEPDAAAAVEQGLLRAAATGVPNGFGPQRFGRDGDNPERALAWVAGRERPPRDRREQRMLFSALQSHLFNQLLAERVRRGTWAAVLPGDIAKKHDSGGVFTVALEGPALEDAQRRAEAGEISPTGPLFGASMRWPEGEPRALEEAILAGSGVTAEALARHAKLGEGTRRALRLFSSEVRVDERGFSFLRVSFVLPKGAYATTFLSAVCTLVEARPAADGPGPA